MKCAAVATNKCPGTRHNAGLRQFRGQVAGCEKVRFHPKLGPPGRWRFIRPLEASLQAHLSFAVPKARHSRVIYTVAGVTVQKSMVTERARKVDDSGCEQARYATGPEHRTMPDGNGDREISIHEMYLRDTPALDYLQSRPDWALHL